MFWLLIVAAFVLLVTYIRGQIKRPPNYPRGPSWLPIVGNLPILKELSKKYGGQHLALAKLAEKYKTNVIGLKLGRNYVITVFSYNTVKAVLLGEEYEGRPHNFFMELRSMGTNKGVTGTDGALWKIQRNFVMTHLRTLGFGKTRMEEMLKEEIGEVLTLLRENDGEVQIGRILAPAVINILWALISGSRISRKDPRLHRMLELLDLRTKAFDMCGGTLSQHPWLRFVAPERTGFNLIKKLNFELKRLFLKTIKEHKTTWYEGRSDDLIHSFISEMKTAREEETTFVEDQLIMVCLDIFIAGSQTTSNTLDFAFLVMVLYPNIQRKVQECLDKEFGQSEEISYADRSRVPYVEATLLEIQRFYTVTPIIGPRRVLRDTVLEGYDIPKDTTVLISLHSIHFDKEYWRDPEVFRPERFLNETGQLILQERVIPFGLGKRRCLGESLARNCVFLFFSEVLRKYNVSVWPGSDPPTGIPLPGITLSPEKYRAKFVTR